MPSLADVQRFLRQKRATGQSVSGEEQRRVFEAFFDAQAARNLERGRISTQRKQFAENLALNKQRQALAERTAEAGILASDRAFALSKEEAEANRAFRQRQEKRAEGAARISGITELGKLGFQAISSPLGQKAITKVGDFLKPSATEVVSSVPSGAKPIGAQAAATQAVSTLAPTSTAIGATIPGGAAPGAAAGTGAGSFAAPATQAVAPSLLSTAGTVAAPAAFGSFVGEKAGNLPFVEDIVHKATFGAVPKEDVSKVTGTLAGAGAGFAVGGPVGALIGGAIGFAGSFTWICTKTKELVGFDDDEWNKIGIFREYAKKSHKPWLKWYVGIGPELLEAMDGDKEFYSKLKEHMLSPVIKLTEYGAMEAAYLAYKQVVLDLANTYAPKLLESTPEGV